MMGGCGRVPWGLGLLVFTMAATQLVLETGDLIHLLHSFLHCCGSNIRL